jgi:hypothetical protein
MVNNRQLTSFIRIGGQNVPVLSWQCHLTSYGNLCTFEAKTSIKQMRDLVPDIFTQQQNNFTYECQIILVDNTGGSSQIVFDGIVDTVDCVWEHDEIEITGRDYSAVLRDTDLTLDQYVNQTIAQVLSGIVTEVNKLQPNNQNKIQLSIASGDATTQIAGIRASTFQGEDWALSTSPKPTWQIIQQLADEVGYVAYMNQHKVLNFEPPGQGIQGITNHAYYWRPDNTVENPILNLNIMQQSRRCSNFTLRVHGFDINGKETIFVDKIRPVGGTGAGHFYNKARQDLTSQNCDQIANNLADEIERKAVVAKLTVEGNTDLNVNDQLTIQESSLNDLLGMQNRQLYITSILHSFEMPDYGSTEASGFLTHITCNQLGSSGGN